VLVGIVQVDDVQVLASSVVVKERHGSKHVEDAEPFCMEGAGMGLALGERWIRAAEEKEARRRRAP